MREEGSGRDLGATPIGSTQTLRASLVLEDARRTLAQLESATEDFDLSRAYYFALVALFKVVEAVFLEVDARVETSGGTVGRAYRLMQEDPEAGTLLREFVDREWNALSLRYESNATLCTPMPIVRDEDGVESTPPGFRPFAIMLFEEGPFAGEDARDVAQRVIALWEKYLRLAEAS